MSLETNKEVKNLFNNLLEKNNNIQKDAAKIVDTVLLSKEDLNLSAFQTAKILSKDRQNKTSEKKLSKSKEKKNNIINSKPRKGDKVDKVEKVEDTAFHEGKEAKLLKEKYRWYQDILTSYEKVGHVNNLLYTFSRLIGGICSTGNEYRKGFCLTLNELISKLDKVIDYRILVSATNKESYHKKTETNTIRNAMCVGRISVFQSIIETSNSISAEIIMEIFTAVLNTLKSNNNTMVEEASVKIFHSFMERLSNNTFASLINNKKSQRVLESIFSLWLDFSKDESQLLLFNLSIMLIFNKISNGIESENKKEDNINLKAFISNLIRSHYRYNLDNTLFTEDNNEVMVKMFGELVNKNKNHFILELLREYLLSTTNFKYIGLLWNNIIDTEVLTKLMKESNKNYQFILTKIATIVMDVLNKTRVNYNKIFSILDLGFFKTFLRFEGGKSKHTNLTTVVNALIRSLKERKTELSNESNQTELTSFKKELKTYSYNLIKLFDGKGFSPVTFKGLFLFLFQNISEKKRVEFVDFLITPEKKAIKSNKMEIESENEDEEDDEDSDQENYGNEEFRAVFFSKINVLRTIILAKDLLNEEITSTIFEYIIKIYLSNKIDPYQEIITYLEDKLVFLYLSLNTNYNFANKKEEQSISEEDSIENEKSLTKGMHKLNKKIFRLMKEKVLTVEDEDYSTFKKTVKLIEEKLKTPHQKDVSASIKEFRHAVLKLLLITQVLYLRSPGELEDTLFDLTELLNETETGVSGENGKKNGKESKSIRVSDKFHSIFTEICLQLNTLGSQTLIEFVMRTFKRVSAYLNAESIKALVEYVKNE